MFIHVQEYSIFVNSILQKVTLQSCLKHFFILIVGKLGHGDTNKSYTPKVIELCFVTKFLLVVEIISCKIERSQKLELGIVCEYR